MWEQTGAGSSPDALRKMLINRSLRTLGTVLLQVALDTGGLVHTPCLFHGERGTECNSYGDRPAQRVHIAQWPPSCAGASWGAFSTAGYIANGGDFFGKIAVEYLAYALGLYFAIGGCTLSACLKQACWTGESSPWAERENGMPRAGVVLDAFLLGATGYAAIQYSTNAEAFLQAVRQVCASAKSYIRKPGMLRTLVACRMTQI